MHQTILKVKGSSNVQLVASAISHFLDEDPEVRIRAVGASAVSQAVKAMAISRGIMATKGKDLYFKVGFTNVSGTTSSVVAMEFTAFLG